MSKSFTLAVIACVSLAGLPAPASAQQASSAMAGTVKDASGAVIPGVTIDAASPVLIEKVRTVVSDEQGLFRIIDLRRGTYVVTFSLTGFATVKREDVELPPNFTATVNVAPNTTAFCDIRPPFQTQLKIYGVYPLPWFGLQVGGALQSVPGPQITASYAATNAQIATSLGRNLSAGTAATVLVDLIPPGTLYGARTNELDLNLKKIFKVRAFRFSPGVDVFNILNRSDVIALNTRYGPSWQQPTNILQGRWIKFGGQFDF